MGVWHNRKALAETVRAFLDTFTAEDAVGLVVKTSQLDDEAVASIWPGARTTAATQGTPGGRWLTSFASTVVPRRCCSSRATSPPM